MRLLASTDIALRVLMLLANEPAETRRGKREEAAASARTQQPTVDEAPPSRPFPEPAAEGADGGPSPAMTMTGPWPPFRGPLVSQRPLSVEALAEALGGLSRHHLHKIVQDLTRMGVTRTVRGAAGGVLLALPPDEIRLGTVVRQLEADQALVECFRPEASGCTLLPGCRLRGILDRSRNSFYETLDRNTLADCLPPSTNAGPRI